MNKIISIALPTALIVFLAFFFIKKKTNPSAKTAVTQEQINNTKRETSDNVLRGNKLLENHGRSNTSPIEDLQSLEHLCTYFLLENKHVNTIHVSTNEDLTKHLLGQSPETEAEVSAEQIFVGRRGNEAVLIDRWGSPYIIHPQSERLLQIRSAGPDRKPYTKDDLVWPPVS